MYANVKSMKNLTHREIMGVNVGVIIVRVANIMLLFGYGYDNQLIIILMIYI